MKSWITVQDLKVDERRMGEKCGANAVVGGVDRCQVGSMIDTEWRWVYVHRFPFPLSFLSFRWFSSPMCGYSWVIDVGAASHTVVE